jgi:hypothetical protein
MSMKWGWAGGGGGGGGGAQQHIYNLPAPVPLNYSPIGITNRIHIYIDMTISYYQNSTFHTIIKRAMLTATKYILNLAQNMTPLFILNAFSVYLLYAITFLFTRKHSYVISLKQSLNSKKQLQQM